MLIDSADVIFKGGHGGDGRISFFGKEEQSRPDGGHGGHGGDLYVVATSDLTLLNQFTRQTVMAAGDGTLGGKSKQRGVNGKDLEILVPFGTSIIDKERGRTLYELDKVGDRVLVCKGGLRGLGNWDFKRSSKQSMDYRKTGRPGEEKHLILSLKLIADFGFIGLPNSGKSSLLKELTNATPKVANYPFTTLSPILGVCENKFLADIPGLIEGASEGKGLGVRFLKHIEKVGVIFHCISSESTDLEGDYETVREEIGKYNPDLLNKKEIILLTKTDLIEKKILEDDLKLLSKLNTEVMAVSIHDYDKIEKLRKFIVNFSDKQSFSNQEKSNPELFLQDKSL
jgi:GTPase